MTSIVDKGFFNCFILTKKQISMFCLHLSLAMILCPGSGSGRVLGVEARCRVLQTVAWVKLWPSPSSPASLLARLWLWLLVVQPATLGQGLATLSP